MAILLVMHVLDKLKKLLQMAKLKGHQRYYISPWGGINVCCKLNAIHPKLVETIDQKLESGTEIKVRRLHPLGIMIICEISMYIIKAAQ